jgi:hypothetical protein
VQGTVKGARVSAAFPLGNAAVSFLRCSRPPVAAQAVAGVGSIVSCRMNRHKMKGKIMKLVKLNTVDRNGHKLVPVQTSTKSGTTNRLLTAKEFKDATGLKGNAASAAYNNYIRAGAPNAIGDLVRRVANGELAPVSERDSSKSVTVRFVKMAKPEVTNEMLDALPVGDLENIVKEAQARIEAAKVAAEAKAKELTAPKQP